MDKQARILITGGTGFLGKNLVSKLLEQDYRTVIPVGKRNGSDLTNPIACDALFKSVQPNCVFHLAAAVGGIGANRKHPGMFWYENTVLGANILEMARKYQVQKTVMVGTTCAYPKYCSVPFLESNIWTGFPEETNAPYGVAKKSIMIGAKAYHDEYGLDIVNPILTNLYGPGDHYTKENSHVIPDMIRKFHEAKKADQRITLWGDGSPSRDFLYVMDACDALIRVANLPVGAEPINFGSGKEVSMRELAQTVSDVVDYNAGISWDTQKPNGQPRRCLDITRARDIGWEPVTDLKTGLMVTYEDYLSILCP